MEFAAELIYIHLSFFHFICGKQLLRVQLLGTGATYENHDDKTPIGGHEG
jgi:hypothetical protein